MDSVSDCVSILILCSLSSCKTINCLSNNTPWINKDVKADIYRKKPDFASREANKETFKGLSGKERGCTNKR